MDQPHPAPAAAACTEPTTDPVRRAARLAESTAGARPTPETAAHRVRAWVDAMGHRIAYDIGFRQGKPVVVGVADARALTEGTITPAQHEQLRATVTAFLTHADGEPRTLARSHGVRPPLFTYDVLVLLDQQEPADVGDDGMTCPNGNRSPECTEIDPCEACTRDVDVEAQEIERSMGLRALRQGTTDTDPHAPMGVHEVTVSRTELITFTVHAASAPDAEERHLTDGHETASKTVALSVDSVERPDPATT